MILFLQGMSTKPYNTSTRVARVMSRLLNDGPGTYHVRTLDSDSEALSDGCRIAEVGGEAVVDLWTVTYRDQLPQPSKPPEIGDEPTGRPSGSKVIRLVKNIWRHLRYFLRAAFLVLSAGQRAKSRLARLQLLVGFAAAGALLLALVLTVLAFVVAVGWWDLPKVPSSFEGALSVGSTAVAVWALVRFTPDVTTASAVVQQMLDYAQNDQDMVKVTTRVGAGLDAVLEENDQRPVMILGYSLGALVAIDYLFPRSTQLPLLDPRHQATLRRLVTIGSPLDFVRLYGPGYTKGRTARVQDLEWTNVFIAADVLGSNMRDQGDAEDGTDDAVVSIDDVRPSDNIRYTNEELSFGGVLRREGFFSHGRYWSKPDEASCLGLVVSAVRELTARST